MIILVASEKGGAGKTTIATTLAAMLAMNGRDVLLLDTDTQATSSEWGFLRDDADNHFARVTVLQKTGSVNLEVAKLVSKYDDIVIDAGGRDSEEMRSALLVSHVWYIPVRPSQFDIWTISTVAKLYGNIKMFNPELSPRIIVNSASTHARHNDLDSVKAVVAEVTKDIPVSNCIFSERSAYRKAASRGCCVMELTGNDFDKKAAAEATALYNEVIDG